jgi:hypothetical protein
MDEDLMLDLYMELIAPAKKDDEIILEPEDELSAD